VRAVGLWARHVIGMRRLCARSGYLRRRVLCADYGCESWEAAAEIAIESGAASSVDEARPAWLLSVEEPRLDGKTHEARYAALLGVPEEALHDL
jgi:hypothetical protein